jgi:peptidoglycan/xylan/chitin deacetylase (PgdA/CDA1 family)
LIAFAPYTPDRQSDPPETRSSSAIGKRPIGQPTGGNSIKSSTLTRKTPSDNDSCDTILRSRSKGTLRFVTPALKHIVFPVLSKTGYLRRTAGARPAVVTYHGVFPAGYEIRNPTLDGNLVHADSLRCQLQLLKKHYQVISPDNFLHWSEGELTLPPRSILLTCDDALHNTLTEMVPLLHEFGLSCLFFATGASANFHSDSGSNEARPMLWYEELYLMLLDTGEPVTLNLPEAGVTRLRIAPNEKHACWWDLVERLSQFNGLWRRGFLDRLREQLRLPENWRLQYVQNSTLAARFLTLDQAGLRQLAAAGMSIGAHSLSHPILARAPDDLAWREISESKGVLEKNLGQTVWAFAYPFGNLATVTRRDLKLAEQAGFRCAFMNTGGGCEEEIPGANVGGAKINRFALPRVHVTAGMNLAEFEAHISGFYHSLRRRLIGSD